MHQMPPDHVKPTFVTGLRRAVHNVALIHPVGRAYQHFRGVRNAYIKKGFGGAVRTHFKGLVDQTKENLNLLGNFYQLKAVVENPTILLDPNKFAGIAASADNIFHNSPPYAIYRGFHDPPKGKKQINLKKNDLPFN
jgi:hypothetical protein